MLLRFHFKDQTGPATYKLLLCSFHVHHPAVLSCVLPIHIRCTSRLEPAGSHGVWGLDDYQFLPFVWGSAQLISHPFIRPGSILNKEVLDTCWEDYLYLSCVRFVKQARTCCLYTTPFQTVPRHPFTSHAGPLSRAIMQAVPTTPVHGLSHGGANCHATGLWHANRAHCNWSCLTGEEGAPG